MSSAICFLMATDLSGHGIYRSPPFDDQEKSVALTEGPVGNRPSRQD